MEYTFIVQGHDNVTAKHKTTFEITTDNYLTPNGNCIIGLNSKITLNDIPNNIKKYIMEDNTKFQLILKTNNAKDIINGFGSSKLTLNHPTDMVCRKSDFVCSRTLMINADKAAYDLNKDLVNDLKNNSKLEVTIKLL